MAEPVGGLPSTWHRRRIPRLVRFDAAGRHLPDHQARPERRPPPASRPSGDTPFRCAVAASHVFEYELPAGTRVQVGAVLSCFGQVGGGVEGAAHGADVGCRAGNRVTPARLLNAAALIEDATPPVRRGDLRALW
ncbi:MAG: hypothetical protein MZW92_16160 [Comamonadaceae bacterium]|nr:hypothetical protein [Comamonadaceae bacterium]